jgi:aryl-alcohol dehydrogenase-like predicted oxidoreductase
MKYRQLPRTNLQLSEVGFGMWTVATNWWGRISEEDRASLLENAVELGVNFFDTADTYSEGYGEELLAKVLGHHRHDLVIATKCGYDFYDKTTPRIGHKERPQRFDPDFIRFACEQSLRRLRTDYIDIYQLHNPRIDALERDDLFDILGQLQDEGKICHYAVALGPDIGWEEEGMAAMVNRNVPILEIIYSILEQEPARNFLPVAEEKQVGLLSRVPHASDVLTGRYIEPPTFSEGDHRAHRRSEWLGAALKKAEQVKFLADENTGRTMSQAAIQFCLAKTSIISVLPNLTNLKELTEYTEAVDVPALTEEENHRLEDLWQHGFYIEEPAPQVQKV